MFTRRQCTSSATHLKQVSTRPSGPNPHKKPGAQRFLFHCSVGRSERRADWIRRARRNRSGLNGHEDFEHSPDSICMSRSSPSLTSNARQPLLANRGFYSTAVSGVASGVQIGYGERAETGMGSMPMRISSTPRIQYVRRAVAPR